jgi:hypothetical protein
MKRLSNVVAITMIFVSFATGCTTNDHLYKVVGQRNYFDKAQDKGDGGDMIEFTITHGGSTIVAT